jgi:AraC-like DNA-binding protein
MAMSRTLFYVKLKSYTGKSPQDFIRIIRLERAALLLRGGHSVAEAAALSGFDNPKYFSTVFKKYFNVSPSKYQG